MKSITHVWWQGESCLRWLLCVALMILVVSGCNEAPFDVPAATDNNQDVSDQREHRDQLYASSDGNLVFVEMTEDVKKEVERSSFFGAASDVLSDYTATPWIMRDKCFEVSDGELNPHHYLYLIGRESEGETELSGLLFVYRVPGGVAGSTLDGFIYSFVSPDTIRMDFPLRGTSFETPTQVASVETTAPEFGSVAEFHRCLDSLECFKKNPFLCTDCCNVCLAHVGWPSPHGLIKKCKLCVQEPGFWRCYACFRALRKGLPLIGATTYGCLLGCCGVIALGLD